MNPKTKDLLIMSAAAAAMIIAGVLLVHMPNSRKLEDTQSKILSARASLEAQTLQASVIPDMMRQIEQMKVKYKDFDRRLPKRKELGGFLRDISENLGRENLVNQSYQPGAPVPQDLFHMLPIEMKLRGPYLSLASFLQSIDQMERLTRVQKLKIVSDPRTNELDITLNMNIYFTES
ncbi:MAG: type 4a pilus biogenesis protein PilO [Planctomycetes bacterium]|nr:type 4a pilus biogenesis protein PilO [Planctomycetota bacterium]